MVSSSFLLFSSPNLSRHRLDVYYTSTHGVALVQISDAGLKRATRGSLKYRTQTRMWANAQRDGRPAEYSWRPLRKFSNSIPLPYRKVWLTPAAGVPCSNAAKTRKPLKVAGVPQTRQQISAVSRPKFTIYENMWKRYRCLTSFSDCRYMP